MLTTAIRLLATLLLSLSLFACGDKSPRMDLEINVTMNGKLVPHARLMMDDKPLGETGDDGQFNASMNKQPGKQIKLEAKLDVPGFEVQPWTSEFTVKLPNEGEVLKYVFDVELKAMPFVVIAVQEKGAPVAGATITVDKLEVGKTNEGGSFVYKYQPNSTKPAVVTVSKNGYSTWKKTAKFEPGNKLFVGIFKRVAVTFETLKTEYGADVGIGGITVMIDGKAKGKTNDMGGLTFNYDDEPGKQVSVTYLAPGNLPAKWVGNMSIEGGSTIRQYFKMVNSKPIKIAFFNFAGNTPGVDLKDVAAQTQAAIRAQLFKQSAFHEVTGDVLNKEIKSVNSNISKLVNKGWQHTRLQSLMDMVAVGSVSMDEKGFLIEVKFHSASGKLIFSQLIRADSRRDLNSAAKELADNIMERFPFEGTVTASKDDHYDINLGKNFAISKGSEFMPLAAVDENASSIKSVKPVFTVKKVGDKVSYASLDTGAAAVKIAIGERVVRTMQREGEPSSGREFFVLSVKGGVAKDASALAGVNIYLNNDWVGTTGSDGHVSLNIHTGKIYNLMLYRHGFQQVIEKIKIEKKGESKQFVMAANFAVFKVESTPSSAIVYVDDVVLGKTPMLDGKLVSLGFHNVRLNAGDNYREWEEVIEFDKKSEDRTGSKKIVLYKDYMKLGIAAEAKGNVDAAIAAYAATVSGHPDYSEAHHRLAQLYLDEKDDFDKAIKEFENVLFLPENEQLIFKQYAIAYTNLGHAYYEKGNNKMSANRSEAAQYYSKAVQNLKTAKQNSRFFPSKFYDQALHDTYYYLALSYQKLYMISNRSNMLNDANLAWRDYFDFFPSALEGDPVFVQQRETAKKFWNQIKDK